MGARPEQDALMRMCTETVYADNPFHLLGLPTTATPRQIRRRREDLEGARELGQSAWEEAFHHLLGNRPVPTSEEVEEAFAKLEDPESRLLAEFFWMWPLGEEDPALKALQERHSGAAFEAWERAALGFGRSRPIAQHNLAVAYQMYAVDAETQAIDYKRTISDTFTRTMREYWEKAFLYWEELADNDDFWELFEARMREFDDPRLTGGFIRRLRQEFPVAFDNINLALAVRYVKGGKLSEARRHVDYMRRTMSGLDDVEQNFSALFAPIEKRLNLLVDQYDEKVQEDPLNGKQCFLDLVNQADGFTDLANGLLEDDNSIRLRLLSTIFKACNRCLIAYGNKSKTWAECATLNERLKPFACTKQLRELYVKNSAILHNNVQADEEQNTCWKCKRKISEVGPLHTCEVRMYGNIQPSPLSNFFEPSVTYSKCVVKIPLCRDCWIVWPWEKRAYPEVKRLLAQGWRIGERPTDAEVRSNASAGCLLPLMLMLLVGLIAGCTALA